MNYIEKKLGCPKRIRVKGVIASLLFLSIVFSLLALVLPHNFVGQSVLASPGPIISVRNKGEVPDGAAKSREYVKQAGYTGNTRTQTSAGPKICVKEVDIRIEELEISAKGEVCVKKVTTWTEREWKETKVTWLEQPWRKIWVAVYFGGIEVDWVLQDETWQREVPGSRTEITETRWERVAGSETSMWVDPPGGGDPLTKQVFVQDERLALDFSFIDNIIPGAPPGTITHKLYLDGISIADGTTLDLKNLALGDHELMVELLTIDGQLIPVGIPFTVVPPLELLLENNAEVTLDETERFEFTLKNNLNADTKVNLSVEGIPPGWDVHLAATSVSVPASGNSTFQVLVRPTIGALPQYTMNATVTAMSTSGYHALAYLDVQAVFPDDATIYQVTLQGEEILAFSVSQNASLLNFRFEDEKILFESEQPTTGFGLVLPRTLIEGPLQATGPKGNILSSVEDLFLSGTHGLFLAESPESGTITISRVEEPSDEGARPGMGLWQYLIIGLVVGLVVGGGIAFVVMRRRREVRS
ncbi:MAG: hypothetical protein HXY36_05460 [Chloroflexi bacterium]|nr:hypothetical protein [Chloroflexota bacterium]